MYLSETNSYNNYNACIIKQIVIINYNVCIGNK